MGLFSYLSAFQGLKANMPAAGSLLKKGKKHKDGQNDQHENWLKLFLKDYFPNKATEISRKPKVSAVI